MATKDDFTEDEWETMQKGVTGAGLLVSVSDPDFTDSFGEASAIAKYLGSQREGAGTELARELAHVRGTGFGAFASADKVEAETIEALRSAVATLRAKAPEEVDPYKQLVLGTAEHAASAKGGVQEGETEALGRIRAALG